LALLVLSIGILIYGIANDMPLVPIAMPLLVVGMGLSTVAQARKKKK
jgi:CHASE2 domain-containing sensor protein